MAISPTGRVIALRFDFDPGPSLSISAEQHVRGAIDGVKNVTEVKYSDDLIMKAWD
jgi:hypothetical protein